MGWAGQVMAQSPAVAVTARLDTNLLSAGQTTTLRVFAQVLPALRANSDRIFSWYVDVLNTNGTVATARYDTMSKTASDNDPFTSSTGTADGANRRGVYDTFLNRPGAGVTNAVELMAIPVQAVGGGVTRFSVRAGSGVPGLAEDFIVAPKTGSEPFTGGDYAAANVDLTVAQGCSVRLQMQLLGGTGPTTRWQLQFAPCPGKTHTVEARAALGTGTWQALPGAPHNSGSVTVTNTTPQRFFRVRAD